MPTPTLETSTFLNKTNLLLAQNQRLVASWLPPKQNQVPSAHQKHQHQNQPARSSAEIDLEEQEFFQTPVPELFGIGAKVPKDGEVRREELSSNDKLRKQLLGKDYAKKLKNGTTSATTSGSGPWQGGSKPRPSSIPTKRAADDDDSEDEGGRSSLGKTVKGTGTKAGSKTAEEATLEIKQMDGGGSEAETKPLKRPSNYLDEVLAERSLKKRKKSKKRKKAQVIGGEASDAS